MRNPFFFALVAFFSVVSLVSCGKKEMSPEEKDTRIVLQKMQKYAAANETDKAFLLLDKSSIEYLENIHKFSVEKNSESILSLGKTNNCQLLTMILAKYIEPILQLEAEVNAEDAETPKDTTNATEKPSKLAQYFLNDLAVAIGFGRGETAASEKVKFREFEYEGDTKMIMVVEQKMSGEGHYLTSKYTFNKEGDQWKINLPSTYTFEENQLERDYKNSGMDMDSYVKMYLESGLKNKNGFYYEVQQ